MASVSGITFRWRQHSLLSGGRNLFYYLFGIHSLLLGADDTIDFGSACLISAFVFVSWDYLIFGVRYSYRGNSYSMKLYKTKLWRDWKRFAFIVLGIADLLLRYVFFCLVASIHSVCDFSNLGTFTVLWSWPFFTCLASLFWLMAIFFQASGSL